MFFSFILHFPAVEMKPLTRGVNILHTETEHAEALPQFVTVGFLVFLVTPAKLIAYIVYPDPV